MLNTPFVRTGLASLLLALSASWAHAGVGVTRVGFVDGVVYERWDGQDRDAIDQLFGETLTLSQASNGSFAAFCIEPSVYLKSDTQYDPATFDPSTFASAEAVIKLFSANYGSVTDAAGAIDTDAYVAFQIALWEVAFDDGNLDSAIYADPANPARATGFILSQSDAHYAQANQFLQLAASYSGPLRQITWLSDGAGGSQDMIYATGYVTSAVPELPSHWLALLGGAIVAPAARRGRKQSA